MYFEIMFIFLIIQMKRLLIFCLKILISFLIYSTYTTIKDAWVSKYLLFILWEIESLALDFNDFSFGINLTFSHFLKFLIY